MSANQNGTLATIGQDPATYDCGFFASFAMSLPSIGTEFSQSDVYAFRNYFLGENGTVESQIPSGPLKDRSLALTVHNAAEFLQLLGLSGYRGFDAHHLSLTTANIALLLNSSVGPVADKNGLLINLGFEHWVCVLGRLTAGTNPTYAVYDPGKTGGRLFSYTAPNLADDICGSVLTVICRSMPRSMIR